MKLTALDYAYIEECAQLDGTEIGDYVSCLIELSNMGTAYGMTDTMEFNVESELLHWLKRFRDETVIKTIIEPREPVTFKRLEWVDE